MSKARDAFLAQASARKRRYAARLLRNRTPSERRLARELGRGWEQQVPFHGYVVDFLHPVRKLIVELDGRVHDTPEAQAHDRLRDLRFFRLGYLTLRFRNDEVFDELPSVMARIRAAADAHKAQYEGTSGPVIILRRGDPSAPTLTIKERIALASARSQRHSRRRVTKARPAGRWPSPGKASGSPSQARSTLGASSAAAS